MGWQVAFLVLVILPFQGCWFHFSIALPSREQTCISGNRICFVVLLFCFLFFPPLRDQAPTLNCQLCSYAEIGSLWLGTELGLWWRCWCQLCGIMPNRLSCSWSPSRWFPRSWCQFTSRNFDSCGVLLSWNQTCGQKSMFSSLKFSVLFFLYFLAKNLHHPGSHSSLFLCFFLFF